MALQLLETKHENMLADRDHQIVALQSEISIYQQRVSESSNIISARDATISDLQAANSLFESTMALREVALADMQNDVAMSNRHIEQQTAKILTLEQTITRMDTEQLSITNQLSNLSAMNESLSKQLQDVEVTNASLQERMGDMVQANLQAGNALTRARISLTATNAKAETFNDALIRAKSVELELRDYLSAEEGKVNALRCKVESLEVLVTGLSADLDKSRCTSEELKTQISGLSEQNREISETLAERDDTIVAISESRDVAMSRISVLSVEIERLEGELSRLQTVLDSTSLQFENSRGYIAQLTDDLKARARERDEHAAKLSRAEVVQADFAKQVTEYRETVEYLQSDIVMAQNKIQSLQIDLEGFQLKETANTLAYKSSVASLEGCITSMQNEAAITKSRLGSLAAAREGAVRDLQNAHSELEDMRTALEAEIVHAATLKEDLKTALRRADDAKQEATDFRHSKTVDEATIQSLKDGYARLRLVQIDSLAELDAKV